MIRVPMNQLYSGKTKRESVPGVYGVQTEFGLDGTLISFIFSGQAWTQSKALRWIKNRNYNSVEYRKHDNGAIFFNRVRLRGEVQLGEVDARAILGQQKYDNLLRLEQENGGTEPFLVEIIAMNFKKKKTVVGNRLRFNRDSVNGMIDKFSGLGIHLGHTGLFGDEKDRIGNTVASRVGEDGNPHVYAYFNPHGKGREFRENLRVADAQGLLNTFAFSVVGKPVDVKVLNTEDVVDEHPDVQLAKDGAYAEVLEFIPKFIDAVNDPALEGSSPIAIVNSKDEEIIIDDVLKTERRKKPMSENITLSEAMLVIGAEESIMLSDLLKYDLLKKAFDQYAKTEVDKKVVELKADEKFKLSLLESLGIDTLLEQESVKKAIDAYQEKVEECRETVVALAEANKIDLKGPHIYLIKNGIDSPLSEGEVLTRIKETVKVTDFSDVPDFFLEAKKVEPEDEKVVGIDFTKASSDDEAVQAQPIEL